MSTIRLLAIVRDGLDYRQDDIAHLFELQRRGLVVQHALGRWSLTTRGREALA